MSQTWQPSVPPLHTFTPEILQAAFDQSPEGVGICDEDGRFVAVNTTLARLLERDRAEIVGRSFLTFVHPKDRAATLAGYFNSIRNAGDGPNDVDRAELRALTSAGQVVWLSVTWTITRPDAEGRRYGIVHLHGLGDRKAVEAELANERRRFRLAFDYAPIGMALIDSQGKLVQLNRTLQTMLGYDAEELLGSDFRSISYPTDRGHAQTVFEQLLSGQLDVHETVKRYRHKDGHIVHCRRVATAARNGEGRAEYLLLHIEDISAEQNAADQLLEMRVRDQLTGLLTRTGLALRVEPHRMPRSVLYIQLEHFNRMEGTLGHAGTQRLVVEVAGRLRSCCGGAALLARIGDGEFAIAIDDLDGWTGATLAGTIATALQEPIVTEHGATAVTTRIGLDTDRSGSVPLETILQRAALAGHAAAAGEGGWARFESGMQLSSARRLGLEADLRRAIDNDELSLVYQPIVEVATGRICGFEALTRWEHPELGPVPAEEFIAIAEHAKLIEPLTDQALRLACRDLHRWEQQLGGTGDLTVSVNISARQFPTPSFPDRVQQCLRQTGLPAHRLVLEITESVAAIGDDAFVRNAHRLRELGVGLAVDDFGVGYSSLQRLARLPITALKLDRSLTAPSTDPQVTAALLRAMVSMTADLGVALVVEGTECADQLAMLRACGVPRAQGFLFGRPQPAPAVEHLLTNSATC
ncbi:MAG TPA: EAL domain-containing protein [Jatrophihabitans sp.]|nr:EAL domain-containing protein [Jatrophihabitans sp.]